jgi:hypothetical protein
MSARDDYPNVALQESLPHHGPTRVQYTEALDEIDRLRGELERCEKRNETLRVACDQATGELADYRRTLRRNGVIR